MIKTRLSLPNMFDKLKSALGGFVKAVAGKIEEKIAGKPKEKEKKPVKTEKKAVQQVKKPVKTVIPEPRKTIIPEPKLEKPEPVKEKPKPQGIGDLLRRGLETGLKIVGEQKISEDILDEPLDNLVTSLIEASVALDVAESVSAELKKRLVGKTIPRGKSENIISKEIQSVLLEKLNKSLDISEYASRKPFIIAIAGINGSGKTTTIPKIARWLQKKNKKVVIAAADTYRAAAIEQLQVHADKLGVKMIKHEYGADAAAVCFDAVQHARAHDLDAVIIDTAGRMHADEPLMEELEKIVRVNKPDLVLLIIDSLVGNDAIEQLKKFKQVRVDGVILTKSDLDKKGGVALSVTASGTPIAFLATGQEYDQLEPYDPERFLEKIIGI